jgi:translation initiation factor IF-2
VVLVVAADDGVMPQTQEAIDHARAADVPIIVALNKIDKPQANIDKVKKQLSELNLTPEDWGGKTITVPVSAKTGQGIDDLLEMILLEAQMLELKADPGKLARGVVIEAKLSKGRGPVSTLLVHNGTLHLNENIIVGKYYGKIRAMFNDRGQSVTETSPAFPVEVLGVSGIPEAGEQFFVIEDELKAKELAMLRHEKERLNQIKTVKRISLEDLHTQIKEGKLKELKLIIKADVQGSLGAIREILDKLATSEIKLEVIHEGVGNINSSDAILAVASNALILGFNVVVDDLAKEIVGKEGVDVRTYNIIYELSSDIKAALEGMLEPKLKKVFLGRAEIRKVFKLSRAGTVAGCFVSKGKFTRTALINLIRNGEVVFEGKLSSLKRFKDDVREVAEGFECGMGLSGFDDIREGDIIEAYDVEKIARKL